MKPTVRLVVLVLTAVLCLGSTGAYAQRMMEKLGRGVVAINQGDGKVSISWRLFGTDPDNIAFNLYRTTGGGGGPAVKLNADPLTKATFFQDTGVTLAQPTSYFVRPVVNGQEQAPSNSFKFAANAPARPYLSIPLQPPEGYTANDASVGDLDGDGEYEVIIHMVGRGQDNAFAGDTTPPVFQAYKLDGTLMWTINLGKNIREGARYTQFMVADFDGDGKAEMFCKTADGTIDGAGKIIGDAKADWVAKEGSTPTRDRTGSRTDEAGNMVADLRGRIMTGPEFLTVFEGATGKALATTDYIPARGNVADWGDPYANRSDRYLAGVAWVDGKLPTAIMCRGYYTRAVLAAWNWRNGKLTNAWTFDTNTPGNEAYRGQGNHNLSVGDVDGDGFDEIVYGAACIDHNGTGLYSTGLRHGDAMHLSVLDPSLPGLQVWDVHETPSQIAGAELRDAKTGKLLWGKPTTSDNGRGMTADIDPRHPGSECWSAGVPGLFNVKGELITDRKPRSCNFAVWWDGGVLRNLLDANRIMKWNYETSTEENLLVAENCVANNGSKSNPCLCADILGDWREEVLWRTNDSKELRVYSTTYPTDHRFYTLMHDPVYRNSVAWQNTAYNQPTHTGFWLGEGMKNPPKPNITTDMPK